MTIRHGARLRRRQHQHGCGGDRRPASAGRRNRRRPGRALFSRRQGRQPGGRRGEARRTDDADRPARHGCLRAAVADVSCRARRRPRASSRTPPDTHTGTAIITVADADNTIVVVPGANALVSAEDVAAPVLAKGDVAVSQFEIPLPTIAAFFKRARAAGATTILNPAPAIACGPELLDLVDILILNETELGFLANTELRDTDAACPLHRSGATPANRRGQNHLRHAGQARRAGACRWRGLDDRRPRREGGGYHRRRRLLCRRRRRAARRRHSRSATRSTTPMPRHRSACNGWAPRRRCRRQRRWRSCSDVVGWAKRSVPMRSVTDARSGALRMLAHPTNFNPARASDRSPHPPPAPA